MNPPEYQVLTAEPVAGDCLPFAFLQVFKKCVLYSPTVFSLVQCPKTVADVRQLLGTFFSTMFADIQSASSTMAREDAFSQFTREFGVVDGVPHDTEPLTLVPVTRVIPTRSIFNLPASTRHERNFLRKMFQHQPIGSNLFESNQSRYVRLINLVTLTEAQITAYHRELYPRYKGIWLTLDLMESVFQWWHREAIDAFFRLYPEYHDDLSTLRPREQFFMTSQSFYLVVPLLEFLSPIAQMSYFLSQSSSLVITFDPDPGHFQTWTLAYPPQSIFCHMNVAHQNLLLFVKMCSRMFPVALPDPLFDCPLREVTFHIRADVIP